MKLSEMRAMPSEELRRKLQEAYQEKFNLRFQFVAGQLTNSSRLTEVRRQIARMQTVLRERQLATAIGEES